MKKGENLQLFMEMQYLRVCVVPLTLCYFCIQIVISWIDCSFHLISANTDVQCGQNLLNQHCYTQMRGNGLISSQSILTFGPKRRKEILQNGHKSKYTRIRCQQHNSVQQEWSSEAGGARHSHLSSLQESAQGSSASDCVWPSVL